MIIDAVVTSQTRGRNQSHQLFILRGQRTFQVGIVVQVVEALYQKIVGFIDILVKARAGVQEMPGDFAFFRNLLFGVEIGWFFPWLCRGLRRRSFRRS